MSGSAGGQFAQGGQEAGRGAGIVQCVEGDCGGKLGRFRAEANLQDILLAHRHQCIEFGRRILFPVGASGEDDRTGFVDVPLALVPAGSHSAAVSAPAVAHDLEMKAWRASQISLKGQSLFLLVPAAQQPVNRQRARPKFHGDVCVVEAAGRKLKAGVQAMAVHPSPVENSSFAGAGGLNPTQRLGSFATVVGGEEKVPRSQNRDPGDNVNQ